MTTTPATPSDPRPFLGLAPFLRMSLGKASLPDKAQELLALAQAPDAAANDLMNLSTALLCMGRDDVGLAVQSQALELSRLYFIPGGSTPPKATILMAMAPGDLAANIPLDCLLDGQGVDIHLLYLDPASQNPLGGFIPEHDALVCAVGHSPQTLSLLAYLAQLLPHWPRPVIDDPRSIMKVERRSASELLGPLPGVRHARVEAVGRQELMEAAASGLAPRSLPFPLLLRPEGSHAGKDLEKIDDAAALASYAGRVQAMAYYACEFIDYRSHDGLHRKMRIAFIDGEPFACHMAASPDWMVHYVNAGMYESAERRGMERAFMEGFDAFKAEHAQALAGIHRAVGLDYYAIDCAVDPSGALLVFEIDHAMVIHAMDPPELFPYKQAIMAKARDAAVEMILRRAATARAAQTQQE